MKRMKFKFRLNYFGNHKFKRYLSKLNGKVKEENFKYCGGSYLRLNLFNFIDIYLPSYMLLYDDEDKLIEVISGAIGHEYSHFILYNGDIKLGFDQHHYATRKMGFGG